MTVQAVQSQSDKNRLLSSLPPGTHRVQVLQADGKTKFKRPDEVAVQDQILLNSQGDPVVMMGRPGRKAKVVLDPVTPDVGEVMQAREGHLADDELVVAANTDPESDAVIDNVIQAMAEEAAALEFERKEAERKGNDTSAISSKRARVLKAMADTWMKRKERLQQGHIDLDSSAFETLMGFVLETVRASMEDAGMRPEQTETVFTKLGKRLEKGWKEEAKARMKEKA